MAKPGRALPGIGFHAALRLSDAGRRSALALGGFLQARPEQLEPARPRRPPMRKNAMLNVSRLMAGCGSLSVSGPCVMENSDPSIMPMMA